MYFFFADAVYNRSKIQINGFQLNHLRVHD